MSEEKTRHSFTIVFASQTGQAKAIAESIFDLAEENDFTARIFSISDHDKQFRLNELTEPMVFVCSTTGDGETPESARKCFSKLKRLDTDSNKSYLKNLNYALLGLGDSNYTNFCNGPKLFHTRFQELGATCFHGPFLADDGVGLELEVEPFKETLFQALKDFYEKKSSHEQQQQQNSIHELNTQFDLKIQIDEKHEKIKELQLDENTELTLPLMLEKNLVVKLEPDLNNNQFTNETQLIFSTFLNTSEIYEGQVTKNEIITSESSLKKCYHLTFSIKNEHPKFEFEPGNSISIISPNDLNEVKHLLTRLNVHSFNDRVLITALNESKKAGLDLVKLTNKFNLSILDLFRYFVDIRSSAIKKATLRMLAECCSDVKEKKRLMELSSKEGSDQFQCLFKEHSLSLLDLLNIFKSCQPPIDYLLQLLPILPLRSYSLCSEPGKNDELEIIFNLVELNEDNSRTYDRMGIATGFLSRLKVDESFFFIKRKLQFNLPDELKEQSIVMIGPGTGIAPFLSFLRHHASQASVLHDAWLFYGCREFSKDFLFREELCGRLSKLLKRFVVAFSRQSSEQVGAEDKDSVVKEFYLPVGSKYVQDSMRFYAAELVEIICERNGMVFVCGDAKNMSKDVFNCLAECLATRMKWTSEAASKYLIEMMAQKRYRQDIWA